MFFNNWGLNFNMFSIPNPYMFGYVNPFFMRFNMMQSFIGSIFGGARNCNCNCQNQVQYPQPVMQQQIFNLPNIQPINYSTVQPVFDNSQFENYMARQNTISGLELSAIFEQNYNANLNYNSYPKLNLNSNNIFCNTRTTGSANTDVKPAVSSNNTSANSAKLGKDFLDRVKRLADTINCEYSDLLAVINSESSFSTTAGYNKKTGKIGPAVGLIQFTQPAIDDLNKRYGLNLTKSKILNMSAIEQLDLAEKFFKLSKSYANFGNKRLSAADLYAITFLSGRANREVLCTKGERGKDGRLLGYYEQNSGLDYNGDGKITKSELAHRIDLKRV